MHYQVCVLSKATTIKINRELRERRHEVRFQLEKRYLYLEFYCSIPSF